MFERVRGKAVLRGMGFAGLATVALTLASCGGDLVPRGRVERPSKPVRTARPAAPPTMELRQCMAKLNSQSILFTPLPDQNFGGGCNAMGSVKLIDIGVPATNLGAMTCGLAANFAAWARFGVQPAARLILGAEVERIETFGTYNCRPIAGSGKLSEHAHSNAVDVSGFLLSDGRHITIQNDWNGDKRVRQFLEIIHASACKRFRTVLSPDYNAAHHDHFHFDMGGRGGFCR
ncbi:extensin family protein [Sphingobium sp. SJ10-10]|uniref:extensin family protein n=1 Tax=unclassified Sphingobium TaxID=2611147 RepID=UPI0007701F69|nr:MULTISPECIES: extensin family protein [Sphingomonadaceae]AMK21076.1 extensin family protein [Sphingobium sp. TKS]MEC6700485.1 extensin family protein [Sphingobium sp. SJ10-10]NML91658.1 extensin family protein [Sphingobium sp. TB-6]